MHVKLKSLIESITKLHSKVDRLARCFREGLEAQSDLAFDNDSAEDWRVNIYGNALIRLRLILENNFRVIETIGLVAVTRYIFELALWLELIQQEANYALIYRNRLIDTQKRYYESSLSQLEREVALLKTFGEEDKQRASEVIERMRALSNPPSDQAVSPLSQAADEIDAKAARSFSIYSDQAKNNGYGFQAYLVETQAIPKVKQRIQQLQQALDAVELAAASKVSGLLQCSKWDKMADQAGMKGEYEYIYSYTSKLLHCTPVSLTTDQKNLEPEEMGVFLRYIRTKVLDIIDLAQKQPEYRTRSI